MSSSASLSSPAAVRFFDAVYNNQLKALKYIMKREKVDPNIGDIRQPSHPTALIHACENLNINLARALLEAKPVGADVNKSDQNGRRAIWWAVHHGNVELAELLIKEFKCEVDFTDKITGCTPLYRAVMAQSLELSALLILGGANVNQFSMDCSTEVETPLILAVLKDDIKMCQLLVKSLCNINHRTQEGFTALHFAVAYERCSIVEFLVRSNARKYVASESGMTPISIAVELSKPSMIRCLARNGYNIDKPDKQGREPLHHAISLLNEECSLALVHWGCKLEPSYVSLAAEAGLVNLMKLLIYINPSSLNSHWIILKEWPLALQNKLKMCDWLTELSSSPLSLKELSRAKLFNCISFFPDKCSQLRTRLPDKLFSFLLFKDLIDERMYTFRPPNDECPLKCHFLHASEDLQCPDIEISDIDGQLDYDTNSD